MCACVVAHACTQRGHSKLHNSSKCLRPLQANWSPLTNTPGQKKVHTFTRAHCRGSGMLIALEGRSACRLHRFVSVIFVYFFLTGGDATYCITYNSTQCISGIHWLERNSAPTSNFTPFVSTRSGGGYCQRLSFWLPQDAKLGRFSANF